MTEPRTETRVAVRDGGWTLRRFAAFTLVGALLALLVPNAARAQAEPGIHVTGTGVAYGSPDQALIDIGVNIDEPSVADALRRADEAMQGVRQAVLALGVAVDDVRTVSFNVWREELRDRDGNVTGERYHVQHSYQVVARDASAVGDLLTAMVEAGANQVGGIQYTLSDPAELQRQAREAAMNDARRKAEELAALAGLSLGAPYAIAESGAAAGPGAQYALREGLGGGSVSAGQLAVRVDVEVRYGVE
ncbi:MAG: SIMPL domain-containing protein [Trueperaceae bacterium]